MQECRGFVHKTPVPAGNGGWNASVPTYVLETAMPFSPIWTQILLEDQVQRLVFACDSTIVGSDSDLCMMLKLIFESQNLSAVPGLIYMMSKLRLCALILRYICEAADVDAQRNYSVEHIQ